MIQVSLDTSFLITFADPSRPHHQVAVDYFRHFVDQKVPMYLSTIAAGEFAVKQSLESLPLQSFRVQTYNLIHAKRSASLFNLNREHAPAIPEGTRACVVNDLKILAQAVEENVSLILTEDGSTLAKITDRLRDKGVIAVETRLLAGGFMPIGPMGVQELLPGVDDASEAISAEDEA